MNQKDSNICYVTNVTTKYFYIFAPKNNNTSTMENYNFDYFCSGCTQSSAYRRIHCSVEHHLKEYNAGEQIALKGDAVRSLAILMRGTLSVTIPLNSGTLLPPRTHSAPYPLGAVALFSESPQYRVDITALDACDLLIVPRDQVEQQMLQCTLFTRNFIRYITTKFDVVTHHLAVVSHRSLRAKIAFYILSIAEGKRFHFDISLTRLAEYLCVERPSLSRTLAELQREGIITYEKRSGSILNHPALNQLCAE